MTKVFARREFLLCSLKKQKRMIKGTNNVDHQYVRNKSKETFISKVFKVQSAMTDKPKVDNFNGFSR